MGAWAVVMEARAMVMVVWAVAMAPTMVLATADWAVAMAVAMALVLATTTENTMRENLSIHRDLRIHHF